MAISVLCPRLRCRAILRVPETVRGKQVRCSNCGFAFIVPEVGKSDSKHQKDKTTAAASKDHN